MDSLLDKDDYRRLLLVVEAIERAPTVAALHETALDALSATGLRSRTQLARFLLGRSP